MGCFSEQIHLNDQETYLHHQKGIIQLKITRKGTECRVQGGERELNIYDSGQYDLNVQIDTNVKMPEHLKVKIMGC